MVRVAVRVDDEPATGTRRRSGRARGARTAPFASRDAVKGIGEAGVPLAPSRRALAARVPRVLARHLGARYPQEAQKSRKDALCFSRRAARLFDPYAHLSASFFPPAEPFGVALRARRLARAHGGARGGARACFPDGARDG